MGFSRDLGCSLCHDDRVCSEDVGSDVRGCSSGLAAGSGASWNPKIQKEKAPAEQSAGALVIESPRSKVPGRVRLIFADVDGLLLFDLPQAAAVALQDVLPLIIPEPHGCENDVGRQHVETGELQNSPMDGAQHGVDVAVETALRIGLCRAARRERQHRALALEEPFS